MKIIHNVEKLPEKVEIQNRITLLSLATETEIVPDGDRIVEYKIISQKCIYNPVEHLRCSFYPFNIFAKELHRRCSTGF